jgi:arylsulfatase A
MKHFSPLWSLIPDSRDQLNNFLGTDTAGCDYIVQQNLDNTLSIIQGDWKYIEPSDKPALEYWTKIEMGNAPQPQLYNLSIDPSEKDNVAEAHPDKVKTLSALLEEVKEALVNCMPCPARRSMLGVLTLVAP